MENVCACFVDVHTQFTSFFSSFSSCICVIIAHIVWKTLKNISTARDWGENYKKTELREANEETENWKIFLSVSKLWERRLLLIIMKKLITSFHIVSYRSTSSSKSRLLRAVSNAISRVCLHSRCQVKHVGIIRVRSKSFFIDFSPYFSSLFRLVFTFPVITIAEGQFPPRATVG